MENAGEVQELRPKIQSRLSDAETLLAECGVRQVPLSAETFESFARFVGHSLAALESTRHK